MATITISVPDALMSKVREQAESLGYADPAEYVLRLLDDDLQQVTDAEIEAELVARATSTERVTMDDEDFREIREAVAARMAKVRA
jgi:Arc/MetJ-type ribon-helix-helix transcriptional regulator